MSYGYREFDEFASASSNITTNPQVLKLLQEVERNIQHFRKNVDIIEEKVDLLNSSYDTRKLREEIIGLVADTAQLAKIANKPIQNLRLKSRELSASDRSQFERLMTNFSSAGIKYKQLQRLTQNLEKELLNEAKESRQRTYSEYSDAGFGGGGVPAKSNPFGGSDDDKAGLMNDDEHSSLHDNAALQQEWIHDTRQVEEREQHMRQLETDILDINDIFRDLGTMVHEQGDMIDNIEANVEVAGTRVEQGNTQLGKAVKHKRCSRKLTVCIFLVVLGVVIALVIGILILLGVLNVYTGGRNN